MKTQSMYSILLLAALVINPSSFAHAENIGNGNGDLVLKRVLETNDGLTPEEKIYQMWIEAEGAVPDAVNDPSVRGEWYGLNLVNSPQNGKYKYNPYQDASVLNEKAREALLFISKIDGLKAGPVTLKPTQIYAYAFSLGNFDGNHLTTSQGTLGVSIELLPPKFEGRSDIGNPGQEDVVAHPALITTSGMIVKSVSPSLARFKTEYRQVAPDIIVGVRKMVEASGGDGPCPEAEREVTHETQIVDEPYKTVFGKTKTRKVSKTIEVVNWKLDPTFAVPGVCEVQLLYQKVQ